MLSQELNERLTRVGPDTPMGNLLRRYWFPIARTPELDAEPVLAVTLLGENLALFRSESGELGLVAQRCPHLRASGAPANVRDAHHAMTSQSGASGSLPPARAKI